MGMSRLGWLIGVVTLLGCAGYIFVYLYRWEWDRALFVTMMFVAVEVALGIALVLSKIRTLEENQDNGQETARESRILQVLQETRPKREHFAWLQDSSRFNVFITILLGAGLVASGFAWLADRVASNTAHPTLERRLAGDLDDIAFPSDGLVPSEEELLAQSGPYRDDPNLRILLGPVARQ